MMSYIFIRTLIPLFSVAFSFSILGLLQGRVLPPGWEPLLEGDRVMERLIEVTAPQVKGAHDAEFALVGDYAYVVAACNDMRGGESADWPETYVMFSIVDLRSMHVVDILIVARGSQRFSNVNLSSGACFVPRIILKSERVLRCFFASEDPGQRESQMWYRDFDIVDRTFDDALHRVKLKTSVGVHDMQPRYFHADAVLVGDFSKPVKDYGLYMFDSFKYFDDQIFVALNNWPGKQNALAVLNEEMNCVEIIGHYNEPQPLDLSESAVNRLPNGDWMAICRQDGGDRNYRFTTSKDGKNWSTAQELPFVKNGTDAKPIFERFNGIYYLGWQESTQLNGVSRSVYNVDVSRDCIAWERKYRFETEKSFQYATFHQYEDSVYLTVTQGNHHKTRKEEIRFGLLERLKD